MNIQQLKESIRDLPDDMEVVCQHREGRVTTQSTGIGEVVAVYGGYVTAMMTPESQLKFLIRDPFI